MSRNQLQEAEDLLRTLRTACRQKTYEYLGGGEAEAAIDKYFDNKPRWTRRITTLSHVYYGLTDLKHSNVEIMIITHVEPRKDTQAVDWTGKKVMLKDGRLWMDSDCTTKIIEDFAIQGPDENCGVRAHAD